MRRSGCAATSAPLYAIEQLAIDRQIWPTNRAAAADIRLDPSLARGLSYYTGAIMEIAVPDLAGSLGGGGRYDNLIGMFLGRDVPACGFSLGLERIIVVMTERNMFPARSRAAPVDVMVTIWNHETRGQSLALAAEIAPSRPARRRVSRSGQARQAVQVRVEPPRAASSRFSATTSGRAARWRIKDLRTGEQEDAVARVARRRRSSAKNWHANLAS